MASNTTNIIIFTSDVAMSIVFTFFAIAVCISFLLLSTIMILLLSKRNFITPTNVLICNTSVATFFYIITAVAELSLFYYELVVSHFRCKIQAYLIYVGINLLMYSYVIQAISRLFFTIFHTHRHLLCYKCHAILIISQTMISFLIPLPSIIGNDVRFRPLKMCLAPMTSPLHIFYLHTFLFFIPFTVIFITYIVILRRAIQSSHNFHLSWRRHRRNVQLARNILIIYIILLFSEIPALIYMVLSMRRIPVSKAFYMFAAAAPPISTTFEKISVIALSKEIRREINNRWRRLTYILQLYSNRIQPVTS